MTDSRGRDTSALAQIDLASGKETVLAANDQADVGGVLAHPTEKNIQAVPFNYERHRVEDSRPGDRGGLSSTWQTVAAGELQVPSRTLDDKTWIVAYADGRRPGALLPLRSAEQEGHVPVHQSPSRSKACRWPRCTRW